MKPANKSDMQHYQSIADNYNRHPVDISVETLDKLRVFMAKQLAISFEREPSIKAFGANLEEHLLTLIRASTIKMNAQGSLIASMETQLRERAIEQTDLAEARNTLQSERDANTLLTEGVDAMEDEVELKQACIRGMSAQADKMATEISRLRDVLQRLADWGGVTTYRGGQCWNDVAREALEQDVAHGA